MSYWRIEDRLERLTSVARALLAELEGLREDVDASEEAGDLQARADAEFHAS